MFIKIQTQDKILQSYTQLKTNKEVYKNLNQNRFMLLLL